MKGKIMCLLVIGILVSTATLSVSGLDQDEYKEATNNEIYTLKILRPRENGFALNPLKILVRTSKDIDSLRIGIRYDKNRDGVDEMVWIWDQYVDYTQKHFHILNFWWFKYHGAFSSLDEVELKVCGYQDFDYDGDGVVDYTILVAEEKIQFKVFHIHFLGA